jgi:C-terminal processing protease CtpA/Prc
MGAAAGALAPIFDAVTDPRGAFALDGVPATGVSFVATAAGYHSRIVNRVRPGDFALVELTPANADGGTGVELVGIGVELTPRDDALVIGSVIAGGGAEAAGLVPYDEILTIDGTPAVDIGLEASYHGIRGPEGSTVVLGVRRAGKAPTVDVPVVRRKIRG